MTNQTSVLILMSTFTPNDNAKKFSPKEIKQRFKNALDKVVRQYGYDYTEDSTRVLTIKVKDRKNSRILYSVDFAFVSDFKDAEGYCSKCIHFNKAQNNYSWMKQPKEFRLLPERIGRLKKNGLWEEMKEIYIDKKTVMIIPINTLAHCSPRQ